MISIGRILFADDDEPTVERYTAPMTTVAPIVDTRAYDQRIVNLFDTATALYEDADAAPIVR